MTVLYNAGVLYFLKKDSCTTMYRSIITGHLGWHATVGVKDIIKINTCQNGVFSKLRAGVTH